MRVVRIFAKMNHPTVQICLYHLNYPLINNENHPALLNWSRKPYLKNNFFAIHANTAPVHRLESKDIPPQSSSTTHFPFLNAYRKLLMCWSDVLWLLLWLLCAQSSAGGCCVCAWVLCACVVVSFLFDFSPPINHNSSMTILKCI